MSTTGATMIKIAKELGYYACPLTLSRLCTHPNINQWSLHKPIRGYSVTTVDPYSIETNCGFDRAEIYWLEQYWNCLSHAKSNNGEWPYLKPNYIYRLGDFRNYNHNAIPPYKERIFPRQIDGKYKNVVSTLDINANADIDISQMKLLDTSHKTWHYGVLYAKQGTGDTYLVLSDYDLGQTNPMGYLDISFNLSSEGTYDFTWCLTDTNTTSDPDGNYLYLPNGYWSAVCSLAQSGVVFGLRKNHPEDYPITVYYSGEFVNRLACQLYLYNYDTQTYSHMQVRVREWLDDMGEYEPVAYHDDTEKTIQAKSENIWTFAFNTGYSGAKDNGIAFTFCLYYNNNPYKFVQFDEEWGTCHLIDREDLLIPRNITWLKQHGWIQS